MGKEKRVGGFDLIWNDGPVAMDDSCGADCIPQPSYPTNTFLGKLNGTERNNCANIYPTNTSLL
jgi:tubulin polyglutamylase TTLL9